MANTHIEDVLDLDCMLESDARRRETWACVEGVEEPPYSARLAATTRWGFAIFFRFHGGVRCLGREAGPSCRTHGRGDMVVQLTVVRVLVLLRRSRHPGLASQPFSEPLENTLIVPHFPSLNPS